MGDIILMSWEEVEVVEVITVRGWQDGSGYTYTQEYPAIPTAVYPHELKARAFDWSFWDIDTALPPDSDIQITVEYFAPCANIKTDLPLKCWQTWQSSLTLLPTAPIPARR